MEHRALQEVSEKAAARRDAESLARAGEAGRDPDAALKRHAAAKADKYLPREAGGGAA